MGVEIILYRPPGLYRNLFKAVPVGAGAVFAYWVSLIFRFPAYPKDKSNNPIQTTSKAAQNKYPDPF